MVTFYVQGQRPLLGCWKYSRKPALESPSACGCSSSAGQPCALVAATASASGVRQRPGEVELGVATVKVECGSIVGAHPSSTGGKYAGFTLPVREKTKGSR